MKINLKNPLVFFDLETTGLNIATDRIVELSYLKIDVNGNETSKTILINPTIPIPPEATAVHGITDDDVKNAPTFSAIARNLAREIEGCDFAGYNSNRFDIPILAEEFLRANVDIDISRRKLIDVQVIFHKMEQRTLAAAYKFYCNEDLQDAHSSAADTRATYRILEAQLERYPELKNDVTYLAEFSAQTRNVDFAGRIILNDEGTEIFNFGKYKGISVTEVFKKDPAYYSWMMNGDFPLFTKKVITNIKLRTFGK